MALHDELGKRMKENYEQIPKIKLYRRTPVVVRLDLRAGHTFCKGFERPFDEVFIKSIQDTAKYLCENVQNCVLSYQESDEISLLLIDYKKLESQAFFDYEVQKVCSITASMATMAFTKAFIGNLDKFYNKAISDNVYLSDEDENQFDIYTKAINKGAMFDSRCFNVPEAELANYFYWRQLDAKRNSIQMVGQANFSHKELHGKSCNDIQEMLHDQKNINWNDFPTHQKRGSCCIKEYFEVDGVQRSHWVIDKEIPIFSGDGRTYIEKLMEHNL